MHALIQVTHTDVHPIAWLQAPSVCDMCTGKPLAHEYKQENVELVKAGCCNLQRHVENCTHFGVPVVVAVNKFVTDTDNELEVVRQGAIDAGAALLLCGRLLCCL